MRIILSFRKVCVFTAAIFFAAAVSLEAGEEREPLSGGLFTDELTVPARLLDEGDPLTLDEVTRLALVRNLEMQTARLRLTAQAYELPAAKSVYDTRFEAFADYSQDLEQNAVVVVGNREIQGRAGFGFARTLPTGTELDLSFETRRNSTNSLFTTLSRYYQSYAKLGVRQPLLRNGFGSLDRKRIRQARLDVRRFNLKTLDEIEDHLYHIRVQYWDLKFSFENLTSRREALRRAQDFYQINHDKLEMGLSENPDVMGAEASVRKRVLEVLEAENQLLSDAYALKVMLDLPETVLLRPEESIEFHPVEMDSAMALEEAMASRRDLRQLELAIEKQKIEKKIRNNERLPELDFEGNYNSAGLDRDMASSQGEIWAFNHPQYFAGFRLSTSLENRGPGSRFHQASLEVQSLEKEALRLKMEIGKDLDQSFRDLGLSAVRVVQTGQIERLQQNKLLEEEKSFNRGRSSSKTMIDYQEDLIRARTESLKALVDYRKALETYHRMANSLITYSGIQGSVLETASDEPGFRK